MSPDATPAAPLWRHRSFARYWVSRVSSTVAMQMQNVAVAWQMYDLTHNPFDLGLVGLTQFIPAALFVLVAGHVADRYDRRRIVSICQLVAGLAGVMLAARLQSGQPTSGEFYELTAIAAVVLGGASLQGGEGTLYKSIIGVFIMVVLGNSLNLLNVDSYWQRVAIGAVIIAAAAADRLRSRR